MAEADIAVPAMHPVVKLVQDAQAILAEHLAPIGPSKADTIKALVELLGGPPFRAALIAAEDLRRADAVRDQLIGACKQAALYHQAANSIAGKALREALQAAGAA